MRIEQKTIYRCDGCGTENANPQNWCTLAPILTGVSFFPFKSTEDFCPACVAKLRGGLENSNVIPLHSK